MIVSGITLHSKHVKYMDGQHIDLDKQEKRLMSKQYMVYH